MKIGTFPYEPQWIGGRWIFRLFELPVALGVATILDPLPWWQWLALCVAWVLIGAINWAEGCAKERGDFDIPHAQCKTSEEKK